MISHVSDFLIFAQLARKKILDLSDQVDQGDKYKTRVRDLENELSKMKRLLQNANINFDQEKDAHMKAAAERDRLVSTE
jgi:hypothetical protein